MTTDKPYWEQDIAECLRVAAEIIGPNSYYLRAAEYIEEMRERLSKLEGSVNTLESECNQLNDLSIKQREQIPFCECGNDPYEEEDASGICSSCGKLLP